MLSCAGLWSVCTNTEAGALEEIISHGEIHPSDLPRGDAPSALPGREEPFDLGTHSERAIATRNRAAEAAERRHRTRAEVAAPGRQVRRSAIRLNPCAHSLLQSHKAEMSQSIGSDFMRPRYGKPGSLAARICGAFV